MGQESKFEESGKTLERWKYAPVANTKPQDFMDMQTEKRWTGSNWPFLKAASNTKLGISTLLDWPHRNQMPVMELATNISQVRVRLLSKDRCQSLTWDHILLKLFEVRCCFELDGGFCTKKLRFVTLFS